MRDGRWLIRWLDKNDILKIDLHISPISYSGDTILSSIISSSCDQFEITTTTKNNLPSHFHHNDLSHKDDKKNKKLTSHDQKLTYHQPPSTISSSSVSQSTISSSSSCESGNINLLINYEIDQPICSKV